ncbi:glycosyltransferase family 2 protein, partial [Campylobacter coli]|nr:glycosyltransferase family 2 protein [Campylobacter coli]
FEKIKIDERLSYGEDVLFCYIYFMFCEKIAVFKTCIYHYEFNPNGRYENKNKEILWQNYQDKVKSNELIKKLSLEFENDKFYKQLFDVLNKEELDLKRRIDNL